MLRFNNQISKPVDFYRPLTVDVSVEYELPKEVAPPPGSAPLLIIHPSAYMRSKITQSPSRRQQQNSRSNSSSHAQFSTRTSKQESTRLLFNDLNSSIHYLKKGNTFQDPIGTGRHHNNGRNSIGTATVSSDRVTNFRAFGISVSTCNNGSGNISAVSRSRVGHIGGPSNGKNFSYPNCDDFGNETPRNGHPAQNKRLTLNSAAGRKSSQHQMDLELRQHTMDRLACFQQSTITTLNLNNKSKSPSNQVASGLDGMNFIGSIGGGVAGHKSSNSVGKGHTGSGGSTTAAASHKRLRMMNQHQQQLTLQQQQHCNTSSIPIEPLNLAITPSTSTTLLNPSYPSNQFSTFGLTNGYAQGSGGSVSNQMSVHPSGISGSGLYASTFPQNHLIPSTMTTGLYTARLQSTKDLQYPITVDKGSGSDSGVCSENDSDVSPPLAHIFAGQPRRSFVPQELPSSGCYCCCCPTTLSTTGVSTGNNNSTSTHSSSTTSSRKSSFHSNSKGRHSSINNNFVMNIASVKSHLSPVSTCCGGSGKSTPGTKSTTEYGSPINTMTATSYHSASIHGDGIHGQGIGSLSLSSVSTALGNSHFSPMDSTPAATAYQYRKWWTSGPVLDSGHNSSSPSLGRWFQV